MLGYDNDVIDEVAWTAALSTWQLAEITLA